MATDDHRYFVRKTAHLPEVNERLQSQAARQRVFETACEGTLRVPRVLDERVTDGLYSFDMEFVRGLDAATYLRQSSFAQVTAFAATLRRYLEVAARRPPCAAAAAPSLFESFYAKVCEIHRKVGALDASILAPLFLGLERLAARGPSARTLCHGDFTLENILVDESGGVWVVDLLDAPFEHYWLDVAKLHQDLAGGWYARHQKPVAPAVLDHVSRQILETVSQLDPVYPDVHNLLVAVTFLRILPYAQTDDDRRFVLRRVAHFVGELGHA
jgi:aminoglycoside phosphotransferase (APT) family kinase protein